MNLLYSKTIFSFRKFTKLDDNAFFSAEFAWPVKAWECYANKIEPSSLDALSLAVLELLKLRTLSVNHIAKDLGISSELVQIIIQKTLETRGYYDSEQKMVTQKGADYLVGIHDDMVSSEKVFGYVFQSMIDGEIFPFFYEGTLPEPYYISDVMIDELKFLDTKRQKAGKPEYDDVTELQRKINKAYHKYGAVYRKTEIEQPEKKIADGFFVDDDEELLDLSFDETPQARGVDSVSDFLSDSEESMRKQNNDLRNARIKLLKTDGRDLFIKSRVFVLKDSPERFIVDSPFNGNETKWYSETFFRMMQNNAVLFDTMNADTSKKTSLKDFCADITNQMFVKLPELKELKPEEYIARNYPEIMKCSLKDKLIRMYMRIVRQEILTNKGYDNTEDVVMNMYRTLEFILNNYISKVENQNKIVEDYFTFVSFADDLNSILNFFEITDECSAIITEKQKLKSYNFKQNSIMTNFYNGKRGKSLREKYYFLLVTAYLKNINFRKALKSNNSLLKMLDFINTIRNRYGGHSDGTDISTVDKKTIETFKANFNTVSKILVTNFD